MNLYSMTFAPMDWREYVPLTDIANTAVNRDNFTVFQPLPFPRSVRGGWSWLLTGLSGRGQVFDFGFGDMADHKSKA
jgi:hypothetical protein